MKKSTISLLVLLIVLIFNSCKKEPWLCCGVKPVHYDNGFAVADSAGHDLLADTASYIMKDTIYTSYYTNNELTPEFVTLTRPARYFQWGQITPGAQGQGPWRYGFFTNEKLGPIIMGFGHFKRDTITATTNTSGKMAKIWVNGVLKYDDSNPPPAGSPYFTLVKQK